MTGSARRRGEGGAHARHDGPADERFYFFLDFLRLLRGKEKREKVAEPGAGCEMGIKSKAAAAIAVLLLCLGSLWLRK